MSQLSLSNVINISVSSPQAGIGEYNTSNLALFTRDTAGNTFGNLGYKIYLSPQDVAIDFGTSSDTYKMSNAIFSQKPNILGGGGYLVIMPYASTSAVVAVQHIAFPTVPATGTWKLSYNGISNITGDLAANITSSALQTALRLLTGLSTVTVVGDETAGFTVTFTGVSGPAPLLAVSSDSLQDATPLNVTPVVTTTTAGTVLSTETLADAITRTVGLVQYFGIMTSEITSQTDMLAAAAVVQALNKIVFFVSKTSADVAPGGMLDLLRSGSFTQSRGLFYGTSTDSSALLMMASYASKGLSVNFEGNNTTITMHLKDLTGVDPDPSMTQTLLAQCQAAGADAYVSLQGVAKVFCSGSNTFYDDVYNLLWFVGALQVAGFNYLATTSTKVPQTESGMTGLKSAYRQVCQQAVTNQYSAPGTWTSPDTFGNLDDFHSNIEQVGYYIYSQPVSQQSAAVRATRAAPLVQIALKEAGALHSSDVIVFINP